MTVEELLEIENKYIDEHKNSHCVYNAVGELVPSNFVDDIYFLERGFIKRLNHIKAKKRNELAKWGLTDFEMLILNCFEGPISYAFKWNTYDDRNCPIPEMCEALDNILDKSPIYDETGVLYRYCSRDDRKDFKINDIFDVSHYLTTTKDKWLRDTNTYIITPKKQGTKARSLYKLYNHGGENQVTFKRNSKFQITKIKEGRKKIFYMKEL